jgi:hypothetical protein
MSAASVALLPKSACDDARKWVAASRLAPRSMWAKCERADWMLWLCGRIGIERRLLVLAACDCAETAPGHKKSKAAVECLRVVRLWCDSGATIDEVRAARRAADAAYAAAAYDAAAAAADDAAYAAAAYAADAADDDAAADDAAAAAADAAAYAAAYAAAARKQSLKAMAVLVRARIPWKLVASKLGRAK